MSELYEEITDCSGGSGDFEDSGSEYDGDSDLTSLENEESLESPEAPVAPMANELTKETIVSMPTETDKINVNDNHMVCYNWDHPNVHEEVFNMLLNYNDMETVYELIASDPKYYFELIKNYTKTKEGYDIYLPDLFNILIKKENGNLIVKFKFYDNDAWTSVGYDNENYNDSVYEAFTDQVHFLLKNPAKRRNFTQSLMENGSEEINVNVYSDHLDSKINPNNLVNQNTTSKIQKYLMKYYPEYVTLEPVKILKGSPPEPEAPKEVPKREPPQLPTVTPLPKEEPTEQKIDNELLNKVLLSTLNNQTYVSEYTYRLSVLMKDAPELKPLFDKLNRGKSETYYKLMDLVKSGNLSEYEKFETYCYLRDNEGASFEFMGAEALNL
jgi:hypothetical protein